MKKAIILFLIMLSASSVIGQGAQQNLLSDLLRNYYSVRDALVAGNGHAAARNADEYIRTANGIDYKIISEGNINALVKDASAISEMTDLNKQRIHFANLSSNMSIIAKAVRLTENPIYLLHCPMKKAGWLSSVQEVKNPYYGNAMLTCGEIIETIKH